MDIKRPILVFISTLFFSVAMITGQILHSYQTDPEIVELSRDFFNIFKLVDENYVDKIDRKQIFLKAANEVASRDQYSTYLVEEKITHFEEVIDGDFGEAPKTLSLDVGGVKYTNGTHLFFVSRTSLETIYEARDPNGTSLGKVVTTGECQLVEKLMFILPSGTNVVLQH